MNRTQAIAWLKEIATAYSGLPSDKRNEAFYEHRAAVDWVTHAGAAIAQIFPLGHALRTHWDSTVQKAKDGNPHLYGYRKVVDTGHAAIKAAISMLETGRTSSLSDGIRAETVNEVLDQATELVNGGYSAAAAVLAGGALETHLRHLCARAGCLPTGTGSISRYKSELDRQRKSGNEVISQTDGKLVESWGGVRNDAAHDPTSFVSKGVDVKTTLIDPIRGFVARNP